MGFLSRCAWGALVASGLLACEGDSSGGAPQDMASWKPGALGAWADVAAPAKPLNLILLTLDTTRADRLHCYGGPDQGSPNFDRLAADGLLFERARATAPITLVAHTSILTGLYPFQHAVRNNGTYVVPPATQTLAELLKAKGYDTGAIAGAFPVDHRFGLDQGFDHYDDAFPASSLRRESDTAQRPAGDVTRLSLEWIDGRAGKPFFLWAHYFDPHFPYEPPEPYRSRFPSDPYQGEVAYLDSEVGKLIDGLTQRGLLENSVVVVVGDHGESLGEHKEHTHSIFVYDATQHVPLLVRLPKEGAFAGASWHGKRVPALVSQVDLVPTMWNALGLAHGALPPLSGVSLLAVAEKNTTAHDWVYGETLVPELEYGASDLRALETDRWKFIRAPHRELYDLKNDPKELTNLAEKESKRADQMAADLETLLKLEAGAAQVTMDQETIEKLRSLGYLAGASATTQSAGAKPDPKDMIWAYELVNEARNRAAEHQPAEALALVDSVLAKHPDDGTAQRIRASCLVRLGQGPEAIAAYDQLLQQCAGCPDELTLQRNRAMAAMTASQMDDALSRTRALLEAHPKEQGFNLLLGQILSTKGDVKGARAAYETEASLFPTDPTALVALGDLERTRGNAAEAEKAYRRALTINPFQASALTNLAEMLIGTEREPGAKGLIEQALVADPTYPPAIVRKAWFLAKDGSNEQAIAMYRAAIASDPTNANALYNLGNLERRTGLSKLAIDTFQRAIATGNAPVEAYINLGVCYAEMGRLDGAINYWQQAIDRDPKGPNVASIRQNIERAKATMMNQGMRPQ